MKARYNQPLKALIESKDVWGSLFTIISMAFNVAIVATTLAYVSR